MRKGFFYSCAVLLLGFLFVPSSSVRAQAITPQIKRSDYAYFDNVKNIIKSTSLIKPKNAQPWTKISYQKGLAVHRVISVPSELPKKTTLLRRTHWETFPKGPAPGCFPFFTNLATELNVATSSMRLPDLEKTASADQALAAIQSASFQKKLQAFFGKDETTDAFIAMVVDRVQKKELHPFHLMQVCKTKSGYLLDTISSKDELFVTPLPTLQLIEWTPGTSTLVMYPPITISGPIFWYQIIPDFFPDGSLLFSEDMVFAQYSLRNFERWQAYKIVSGGKKITLVEDCVGNFLRDQDTFTRKGSVKIIAKQGYQYACKPIYKKAK